MPQHSKEKPSMDPIMEIVQEWGSEETYKSLKDAFEMVAMYGEVPEEFPISKEKVLTDLYRFKEAIRQGCKLPEHL